MLNRGWRTPDGDQVEGLRDLLDRLRLSARSSSTRATSAAPTVRSPRSSSRCCARSAPASRAPGRRPGVGRPAPPGGHRPGGHRAADAARPAPATTWPARSASCRTTTSCPPRPASTSRSSWRSSARRWPGPTSSRCPRRWPTRTPSSSARCARPSTRLNRMIEQREAGEPIDPSFESFMEQFGDLFPGDPKDLDELLEQLAARMAAAQAMFNSMSPEQRAQLQGLAESLLEDMDLRWQVDRLAGNLQQAFPDAGWEQRYRFSGDQPMGMGDATDAAANLRDLDDLEAFLRSANSPGRPVRGRPGQGGRAPRRGRRHVARPAGQAGQAAARRRTHRPARGALRADPEPAPGASASRRCPTSSASSPRTGWATTPPRGPAPATTARRPPSPTSSAIRSTSTCPARCTTRCAGRAAGCRSGCTPDDFEVIETEALTRSATVLLLDLSLSMPMRDNFVPAKKMAMALHTLITTRFPRDYLGLVGLLRGGPGDRAGGPSHRQLGLRLRHQPPARADPGPQDARPPAGHQADHPGDRRGADRPHRPLRRRASATTCSSTTRRSPRPSRSRWRRCCGAPGPASPSTPSSSIPTAACGASSTSCAASTRAARSPPSPDELGDYVLVDFLRHKTTVRCARAPADAGA